LYDQARGHSLDCITAGFVSYFPRHSVKARVFGD
jgi:hypothetical protein